MNAKMLKGRLEKLYSTYDISFLASDPLWFPHQYKTAKDREAAGLIASSLAYGRVDTIKKSVASVLGKMGKSPHSYTMEFTPSKGARDFKDFVHRFSRGKDISCLILIMRRMAEESGSIGAFFMEGCNPEEKNIKSALASFSRRALSFPHDGIYGASKKIPKGAGVRFFFPSPDDGSPCKRLNLYLRWMVRSGDALDFGIWKDVNPSKLIIPLDTHVARISKRLGLTSRPGADWKAAEEITDNLKKLDPRDPVKYDFAISRLGIVEECGNNPAPELCSRCIIKDVCVVK